MADLQNYLFRVYSKFHIVSLDNDQNLQQTVQVLNKYNLNNLIRLLVFGHIDGNSYYNKTSDAKLSFLSLLYNKNDGSMSPLAVNLISDMPDSRVFRVDLGYLLLGKPDMPEYNVSLDTFMWILIFYSCRDYINIKQNLIEAIQNLTRYCKTEDGIIILERFPRLNDEIDSLEKLIVSTKKNKDHVITPSIFSEIINSIGTELLSYIEKHGDKILKEHEIGAVREDGGSGLSSKGLADILNAMFEIFKAGYYPASIASVLPDTIFATMDVGGVGDISGLADYLLSLNGREYLNNAVIDDTAKDMIVRVVLKGTYATTCILNENYERWSHIEKRLPGAWELFKIIYNRLKNGEYDTEQYKFSTYRLPLLLNDSGEEVLKMSRVSWLALFSSFIMGHILNLIGRRNAKHLYKVAAPVVRLSQENIYLAPDKLHDLKDVVVRYDLESQTELKPTLLGKWLKYVADNYYTSSSNNPTGGVGYNSRYSIVITEQGEGVPKEITMNASESALSTWQEVVEGKVVLRGGSIEGLDLFFYNDEGQPIDIANVKATNNKGGDSIENKELSVQKVTKIDIENE